MKSRLVFKPIIIARYTTNLTPPTCPSPMMAATRKILSATCAILALTWFCHLLVKKNWKWKMTLTDPPPPYYGIFHKFFKKIFEPFPKRHKQKINLVVTVNESNSHKKIAVFYIMFCYIFNSFCCTLFRTMFTLDKLFFWKTHTYFKISYV